MFASIENPGPQKLQFGTLRFLGVPVVFGAVFALLGSQDVLILPGYVFGGVGASALAVAVLIAPTQKSIVAAVFGTACGVVVAGVIVQDPCTGGGGLFIGPAVGLSAAWLIGKIMGMALEGRTAP